MPGWKQQMQNRVRDKKEGSRFTLSEGDNTFRILPNKQGTDYAPCIEFRVHWNVGPEEVMTACGKDIDGNGDCWLCDTKIPELEKSQNPKRRMQADNIGYEERLLMLVSRIDPDTGRFSLPKPLTLSSGGGAKSLSTMLQNLLSKTSRSYDDPVRGYNITVNRTGTGLKTVWDPPVPDEKPSKVPQAVLDAIKPLESYLDAYSEKAQQDAYFGRKKEADDEGDGYLPDDAPPPEDEDTPEPEGDEPELEEELEPEPADPDEPEPEEEPEPEPEELEPEPPPPPRRRTVPAPPPPPPAKRTAPAATRPVPPRPGANKPAAKRR